MSVKFNRVIIFSLSLAIIFVGFLTFVSYYSKGKQSAKGVFCGGIANIPCPTGYECLIKADYPDAGGTCIKKESSIPKNTTVTPTSSELIRGYKIYSNLSQGYSVQYPSNWQTKLGDNGQTTNFFLDSQSPEFVSITVHENSQSLEIHQWLIKQSIVPKLNDISSHIQVEDVVVAGISSVKILTSVNGGQYSVYVPKGDKVYSLYNNVNQVPSSTEKYNENIQILDNMVSSFKLL